MAGSAIPFAWLSLAGAEYDNAKIVYMTPQFLGFDFGVQYAPNMANSFGGNGFAANPTSINQSAGIDATRWINQVAVGGRYQGTFGGVGIKAYAVYETAGKESISGGGFAANGNFASQNAVGPTGLKYDNLSFVSTGAALTYSAFTLGVNYIGGALNGQLAMRPTGGAPENAVVVGLTYRNGPVTLGIESGFVDSQGDVRLTKITQRHEWEIAFGGTYTLAPGVLLAAEYFHSERHQGGFNFVTNTPGVATRDAQAQSVVFSTIVNW